jgi:acyl-coenzyme A thioesterase PaaI-like protein
MKDWLALEQAAAALRRLNRAMTTFDVPDDELRDLARVASALSQRLEAGGVRQKEQDMLTLPYFVAAGERPPPSAAGDTLEFDPFSLGGGRLHPSSVGIDFTRETGALVTARCTVPGMFQGPPGRVHGGVVAVIVDELMGTVVRVTERRAFTARLQVQFRAPAPVEVELTFRAWVHDVVGRKIEIRAEGHAGEVLFVEADALFIEVTAERPPS